MNLSLLQLFGKYLVILIISTMSYFNIGNYNENNITNSNSLLDKDGEVINSIDYETVTQYNEKIPSNITNVLQEGVVGLSYQSDNEVTIIDEATDEVIEVGTGAYGIYKGKLVGYGPDCIGCSGEGYLACKTASGERFSLKYDGIYYEDDTFGSVRILASNLSKFPCGTIIEVGKEDGTKFLAVVMDRINTTMENGELMDLAYSSQTDKTVFAADGLVGNNITYSVQRWGW